MNAFGSLVYDSSVTQAWLPEGNPLGPWPGSVCFRLDAFPCEPNVLADRILSPAEREYWRSMRGVEKRRHEWLLGRSVAKEAVRSLLERNLDLHLSPEEIEIMPDPYGRPLVKCGAGPRPAAASQAALSIAHSHGTAVALAVLDPEARVGIDLESLTHRREDFETIAFSPDERSLLAALPRDLRREWALRMWCAKEAVGKALGRGLSAGLLAFHVTRAVAASGIVEVELRDGALEQCPQLRGKSLNVYTGRGIQICVFFDYLSTGSSPHEAKPAGDTGLPAAKIGRVDRGLGLSRSRQSGIGIIPIPSVRNRCCSPSWDLNRSTPWFCAPPSRNITKPRCLSRNCWRRSASTSAICRSTNSPIS